VSLPPDEHSPLTFSTPSPEPSASKEKRLAGGAASFFKELPVLILIAFGLALLIKTFLIQAFYIPSESMVPTLQVGDRVLVNKIIYRFREPRRGEIVVFVGERLERGKRGFWTKVRDTITSGFGGAQPAEKDFIKRVIGLPGETLEVRDGTVTITPTGGGTAFTLDEPYVSEQRDPTPFGPFTVPRGQYFVMGDNRPNSADSRGTLGPIRRSEIVGKAFVRIWPLSRFRGLRRPTYTAAALVMLPVALPRRRRAA
jgi:signal peptidase I